MKKIPLIVVLSLISMYLFPLLAAHSAPSSPDRWGVINSGVSDDLTSIVFPTTKIGYAVADGALLSTNNGGATWALKYACRTGAGLNCTATSPLRLTTRFNAIAFSTATDGFAVANDGRIYVTHNSGSEWAEPFACQATVGAGCTGSSPDRVTANLRDVDSTASDSFIAVGDSGTIIREANGVISTVPTPAEASSSSLRAIDIVSSSRMTTVGSDGTILTSPNGVSWTPQYACTSNDPTTPCTAQSGDRVKATLQDVSFTTSLGFAVGQGGVVLKAPDASSNPQTAWKVQSSPTTDNLNGVVATETGAYAVGDNGTVLLGSNTGTSWEKVFVCTASDPCQQTSSDLVLMPLSSVARPDLKSAVAVGTNGSIVATGTPLLAPSASPSTSTSTSPSPSPSSSGGGGGGGGQRSALSIEYKKAKKEFTGTLISTDKACTRQRIVYVKRASSPPKRVASTVTDRHGKWRAFLPQVRPGRYFALSPSDDRGHVTCEKAKSAKVRVR